MKCVAFLTFLLLFASVGVGADLECDKYFIESSDDEAERLLHNSESKQKEIKRTQTKISSIDSSLKNYEERKHQFFGRFFNISDRQAANLRSAKKEHLAVISSLETGIRELKKGARVAVLKEFESLGEVGQAKLNDAVRYERVLRLRSEKTVTFLPSPDDTGIDEIIELLLERGYTILFDADESTSDYFTSRHLDDRIIGISVRCQDHQEFCFENPYFKFNALRSSRVVIAGKGSVSATALRLYNEVDVDWFPKSRDVNDLSQPLYKWAKILEESSLDIGLSFRTPALVRSVAGLAGSDLLPAVKPQKLPPVGDLKKVSFANLFELRDYVRYATMGAEQLDSVEGYAVFGSSGLHQRFANLTFQVGATLANHNQSVVTGGAGGMMLAANLGAFSAEGESVGIPIQGRNQLATETRTFAEYQTITVGTGSYWSRVDLLIDKRKGFVFVPGRSGTMRELSTALVQMQKSGDNSEVIFVLSEYYEPLVQWLNRELPNHPMLARIHLVEDDEELSDYLIANGLRPRNQIKKVGEFPEGEFLMKGPKL